MIRRIFWLIITLASGLAISADRVEIELRHTPDLEDDYLCWTPVPARARLVTDGQLPKTVKITTESLGTGELRLGFDTGNVPTRATYQSSSAIDLVLPTDGQWVNFYVNGVSASTGDKDIRVVVKEGNVELGAVNAMVRVRKDASQLSVVERQQFLQALADLHGHGRAVGPSDNFMKYARAHEDAFSIGIHHSHLGMPLFLAWHRAFLLSLERDLQRIDPRVALPYWRFEAANPSLFTDAYFGVVSGEGPTPFQVQFLPSNPLNGWYNQQDGPLQREQDGGVALSAATWPNTSIPMVRFLPDIMSELGADEYGSTPPSNGINSRMEFRYHNGAHAYVSGWLADTSSPKDPLFFLLHANVDRGWAQWQEQLGRYDRNDQRSYVSQGTYPGPADPDRIRKGSYSNDPMWPWVRDDGQSTADPWDDWPSTGFAFPQIANIGPQTAPTPADMIDYMNVLGNSVPLGACYDGIPYVRTGGR